MDYHWQENASLLMSFLRHKVLLKCQKEVLKSTPFLDIFVGHQMYPSTGCSPAEPISV